MRRVVDLDQAALAAVRRLRRPWLTAVLRVVTQLGAPWGFGCIAVVLWLVGGATGALLLRRMLATGIAWLVAEAVKRVARRRRPDVVMPEHPALVANPDSRSFPSGHAATSVATAVAFAGVDPRLTVSAAVLAALVSFSRVYLGVHFPLDVAVGGLVGALSAMVASRFVA